MVVQWDPLRQFRPIQAEAVDELRGPHPIVEAGLLTYDVYLRGDELLIEFDVPGVGPSDLEVTLEDRTLVVRANRAPVPARGVDVIDSGRQHGFSINDNHMLRRRRCTDVSANCQHAIVHAGAQSSRVPTISQEESSTERSVLST